MKLSKIEFWVATIATLILLPVFLYTYATNDYETFMRENNSDHPGLFYSFASITVMLLLCYGTFLLLNTYIFDRLLAKKQYDRAVAFTILWLILLLFAMLGTNLRTYVVPGEAVIPATLIFYGTVLCYIGLKKAILYGLKRYHNSGPFTHQLTRKILIAFGVWLFVGFFILQGDRGNNILPTVWFLMVPCGYILFLLNTYWLLPDYEKNHKEVPTYILKVLLSSFVVTLPFNIPFAHGQTFTFIAFWLMEAIVSSSLAWYLYHRNRAHIHQLLNLQSELGKTTADLQFLRTQINPHFLFNALNTLYGTALQENGDRTAQGIQKLGDMMRFMLQDNLQDQIALDKETEYLRNYIELQLLRTQSSENITIETDLNDSACSHQIAPMLMIPFVENAFKHGISLKEKSWIKVVLNCDEQHLYFDVYNSLHPKDHSDPEKEHTGIGLENVKQRIALLYPEKHELIIRQTAREFIVHLTIQLTASNAEPVLKMA